MANPEGPLAGVKIVDLSGVVLGPFSTQILAGMGAEIIKVEPLDGDVLRQVGPMVNPGMGHLFLHANRGKRSIALDLKQASGREALMALVKTADVFLTHIRVAAMERLGLGYAALQKINPQLIYVNCVGFGESGPYAGKPAYDDLIQGASAIPSLMHRHGTQVPMYPPMTIADRVTGLHATYAITAALYAREKSGGGQQVEVPMFECVSQFVLGDHMSGRSFEPSRGETGYARLLAPFRRPYQTRDGHLCVLIYNDKQWRRFFELIDQVELLESDPRFSSHSARAENIEEVYAFVAEHIREKTTLEWQTGLDAADIPNQPVRTIEELIEDKHLEQVGLIGYEDHPSEGRLRTLRNPVSFSETVAPLPGPAPKLGEHTTFILREAGYADDAIDDLLKTGVASQAS